MKKELLARHLREVEGWNLSEIDQYLDDEVDNYLIVNEQEREQEIRDYYENLIDDIGFDGFTPSFKQYIINYCLDTEYFQDYLREYIEMDIEDLRLESPYDNEWCENRVVEMMEEYGVDTEDDLIEALIEEYGDPVEWYADMVGEDELFQVAVDNDLIDINAVIDELIYIDGYDCLATYDNIEHEYDINGKLYFIYKIG